MVDRSRAGSVPGFKMSSPRDVADFLVHHIQADGTIVGCNASVEVPVAAACREIRKTRVDGSSPDLIEVDLGIVANVQLALKRAVIFRKPVSCLPRGYSAGLQLDGVGVDALARALEARGSGEFVYLRFEIDVQSMLKSPELIEPLFRAAGWRGSGQSLLETGPSASPEDLARRIIQEFSGLQVGDCRPGAEQAASDITFYTDVAPRWGAVVAPWQRPTGKLWAFASAQHDHMVLFVATGGQFYIYTEPDDRLYEGGSDFGELARKLLWGYKFGPEVPRDAS